MNQKNTKLRKGGLERGSGQRSYRPLRRETHLVCSPKFSRVCISAHARTQGKHTNTHTQAPNPSLLLTNERIITFADMWRGGGEAEERGTVHFSKQEMNSPCCGHLSLGREGGGVWLVAHSPRYPLKPNTEPVEAPPVHQLGPAEASTGHLA